MRNLVGGMRRGVKGFRAMETKVKEKRKRGISDSWDLRIEFVCAEFRKWKGGEEKRGMKGRPRRSRGTNIRSN